MDRYNHPIPKFLAYVFHKKIWAITISKDTCLYSCFKESIPEKLFKEEEKHKKQIAEDGWIRFMFWYLRDLITHGYQNNPYEEEAKKD